MTCTTLILAAALAQTPSILDQTAAEYPPADARLVFLVRGGLARKEAAREIAEHPDTPGACRAFARLGRRDEAIDCVQRVSAENPQRMAEALPAAWSDPQPNDPRDYSAHMKQLAIAAHAAAAQLPREDRAAAEYQLLSLDALIDPQLGRRRDEQVAAFLQTYQGTKAALDAEIQNAVRQPFARRLDTLDEIARAHPGTDIAAHALYQKGFELGHNAPVSGPEVQWDPTERFLQAIAIATELERGGYPKDEWVTRAPSLVAGFYAYKPQYAPGNVDKVLDGYTTFLATHIVVDAAMPLQNGVGYVISNKMAELFALKKDADGVERTLGVLERASNDPAGARYLHALYLVGRRKDAADDMLKSIVDGGGPYARRALATLATLRMELRRYESAHESYLDYVRRYPQSPYAWVAALRAGECEIALGRNPDAQRTFDQAVQAHASNPLAAVIGHGLNARAYESGNASDRAAREYEAALRAWDDDYGLQYSLFTPARNAASGGSTEQSPRFDKADVGERVAQLHASLAQPGGSMFEYARWLLSENDRVAAESAFNEVLRRFPRSALAPEARLLMQRAQLGRALDLVNIERPDADPERGRAALDALAHEPLDASVAAARIARASAEWTAGDATAARADLGAALKAWLAQQSFQAPANDLENDVAAIRETVFLPLGGSVYGSTPRGWNAFTWPAALPQYVIVNPQVQVKLPSGETVRVSVSEPIAAVPNVLYADAVQLSLLSDIINAIGGTKRRAPGAIMETPNQPVGPSTSILALWNEFFPGRPGHWGGWEFLTYPVVTRIEFLDAARTKAAAAVTIGYSGATVVLEKRNGTWTAVRLTNWWIT